MHRRACTNTRKEVLGTRRVRAPRRLEVNRKASDGTLVSVDVEPLRHGVAARQGPREEMEDEAVVMDESMCGFMYAAVFDGHGGLSSADYLRLTLFETFRDVVEHDLSLGGSKGILDHEGTDLCCPRSFTPSLVQAFHDTDKKLLGWLATEKKGTMEALSGATATVLLARKDRLVVANVGDSRAVLCRGGKAVDLSSEHRVHGGGEMVEQELKRIQAAGGWVDDGRVLGVLAVSRAFGDVEFKGDGLNMLMASGVKEGLWSREFAEKASFSSDPVIPTPDVTEIVLGDDDEFVIVASDGLWDVMPSQQVVQQVRKELQKHGDIQLAADNIADLAVKRYTQDNVAVIIIDLDRGLRGSSTGDAVGKKKGLFGMF